MAQHHEDIHFARRELPHTPISEYEIPRYGTGISNSTYKNLYEKHREVVKAGIIEILSDSSEPYVTTRKLCDLASLKMKFDGNNHPLLKRILVVPGIEELLEENKIELKIDGIYISVSLKERMGHS